MEAEKAVSIERWSAEIANARKELVEAEKVLQQADTAKHRIVHRIAMLFAQRDVWIRQADRDARHAIGVPSDALSPEHAPYHPVEPPPPYCANHGWHHGEAACSHCIRLSAPPVPAMGLHAGVAQNIGQAEAELKQTAYMKLHTGPGR